jgi:hypothetical protein
LGRTRESGDAGLIWRRRMARERRRRIVMTGMELENGGEEVV